MSRSWTRVAIVAGLATVLALQLGGCRRSPRYSQDTPEDVVKSAVAMVKDGNARNLGNLIYAEDDRMRAVLNRLGNLLGDMQKLAAAIKTRFPEDVERLKAEAQQRAAEGADSPNPLAFMMGGGGGGQAQVQFGNRRRGGRRAAPAPGGSGESGLTVNVTAGSGDGQADPEDTLKRGIAEFFADPYGWLDRNASRLGTTRAGMSDDMAAVTLDGQPVLPPIGIPLQQDKGKWYVALPIRMPGVSNFMPRSDEEWAIIASFIRVLNQTVVELTADVESNRIGSINALADKAGEKAMMPAMISFGAYMREMDVRQKRERIAKQFGKRQKEWIKSVKASSGEDAIPEKLPAAIDAIAAIEVDKLARRERAPDIEKYSDGQFVELVEGWFVNQGLKLTLTLPIQSGDVERAIAEFEAKARAAKEARKKK